MIQNHTGYILDAKSVTTLTEAMLLLQDLHTNASTVIVVRGKQPNAPRMVAFEARVTRWGMVTTA